MRNVRTRSLTKKSKKLFPEEFFNCKNPGANASRKSMHWILAASLLILEVQPPEMPLRPIAGTREKSPGEQLELREGDMPFTLYLPPSWNRNSTAQTVTLHFHTAAWYIIQEHVRRGSPNPLACIHLGEGSSVYRRAFEDPQRLQRTLGIISGALQKRSAVEIDINAVELSSFSAGYGAIRELVKTTNVFSAVVLADSMYASLATNAVPRRPAPEHINVWLPLARAATNRQTTFVFTYSEVPTTAYASSGECATALVEALQLTNRPVELRGADFPLLRRVDSGNLHIWGYAGTNAQAHLTHVRHLADIWRALDRRNDFGQ